MSGLPYLELEVRSMVGLAGWKLVDGRLVSVDCVCMVAVEIPKMMRILRVGTL